MNFYKVCIISFQVTGLPLSLVCPVGCVTSARVGGTTCVLMWSSVPPHPMTGACAAITNKLLISVSSNVLNF